MRFEWDPAKERRNRRKHGVSFDEAVRLFTGPLDFLEIYDEAHSLEEDRFIAIGVIDRGVIVVAFAERADADVVRIVSAHGDRQRARAFREVLARRR